MKNFTERQAWAYLGTAQFFGVPPIISGTGKAADFKFGHYIQSVHPNKSPLNFLEKMERERIQGLPNFFGYPLLSRSATGKATKIKFCLHIYRLNRNKSPLKNSGNIAVGVLMDSRKLSEHAEHPYIGPRAHRTVIFAIAQLSCS